MTGTLCICMRHRGVWQSGISIWRPSIGTWYGGYSNLIQATGPSLPCCERLRSILYPGHPTSQPDDYCYWIPTLYYEGGQATTKQYCDCLLFWLHIGKASSPFTSGQQKLCTSSIMDQKLISLNCTHYQKQNKTNILSFLLFINAALEAVQQIW